MNCIQEMIEHDRLHNDIVIQLSAAEKAINRVNLVLLKGHIEMRISDLIRKGTGKNKIDELVNTLFGPVQ